jgi:hypothetical protein
VRQIGEFLETGMEETMLAFRELRRRPDSAAGGWYRSLFTADDYVGPAFHHEWVPFLHVLHEQKVKRHPETYFEAVAAVYLSEEARLWIEEWGTESGVERRLLPTLLQFAGRDYQAYCQQKRQYPTDAGLSLVAYAYLRAAGLGDADARGVSCHHPPAGKEV